MEYVIHILFSIITSYLFFKNFKIFAKKLGLIDNKTLIIITNLQDRV